MCMCITQPSKGESTLKIKLSRDVDARLKAGDIVELLPTDQQGNAHYVAVADVVNGGLEYTVYPATEKPANKAIAGVVVGLQAFFDSDTARHYEQEREATAKARFNEIIATMGADELSKLETASNIILQAREQGESIANVENLVITLSQLTPNQIEYIETLTDLMRKAQ